MTMTAMPTRVALSAIDVGENVRELDEAHVDALARSIALRGLISPLTVRPAEEGRFVGGGASPVCGVREARFGGGRGGRARCRAHERGHGGGEHRAQAAVAAG
jgi:hypothetical protein